MLIWHSQTLSEKHTGASMHRPPRRTRRMMTRANLCTGVQVIYTIYKSTLIWNHWNHGSYQIMQPKEHHSTGNWQVKIRAPINVKCSARSACPLDCVSHCLHNKMFDIVDHPSLCYTRSCMTCNLLQMWYHDSGKDLCSINISHMGRLSKEWGFMQRQLLKRMNIQDKVCLQDEPLCIQCRQSTQRSRQLLVAS